MLHNRLERQQWDHDDDMADVLGGVCVAGM
jgi:hypothetical protein